MVYKSNNMKFIDRFKVLSYIIVIFFLNRMISMNILGNISVLTQLYVLISELFTLCYTFKWISNYVINKKMHLYDVSYIIGVIIYFILLFIITYINDGNIRRIFMTAYPIIGTLCFLDLESKKYKKELLYALYYFFYIIIVINFIDMLFVKHVLSNIVLDFLISGRNQIGIILAVAISCTLAFYEDNKDSMSNINHLLIVILNIMIFVTGILAKSATTLVVITIIYLVYFLSYIKKRKFSLNPYRVLFAYIAVWIALIVLRMQYLVSDLIVNILHKDLTLSHRTILWDEALRLIRIKPITGYGMSNSVNVFTVNHDYTGGNNIVYSTLSAHNEILQILYYGGVVLISFLIVLYFICCSSKRRLNDKFILFYLSVIAILIVWLSEVPGEYALFFTLGLCFYSNRFNQEGIYE